ncbi:MAG: hypothetical protein LBD72_01755 [Puniceicoccales bacterium]|jgi:hypothetical protein|nr:hypothetical protein [Puniceicoccales bacterium]
MTFSGVDVANLIDTFGPGGSAARRVEDRVAFTPNLNVGALRQRVPGSTVTLPETKPTGTGACTDSNLDQKKMELAQTFAARLDPNGKPELYLAYAHELITSITRNIKVAGRPEADADATGDRDTATFEAEKEAAETAGAAPDEGEAAGRQMLNISAYPPSVQKILKQIIQQFQETTGGPPRMVAEIFNFAKFTLVAAEKDRDAYAARGQRCNDRLIQLSQRKDPKGIEKFKKTEKLLIAIEADTKNAAAIHDQLLAVVTEMERLDGKRIDDGFNIAPKAYAVLERQKTESHEGDISVLELATVYIERVLNYDSPSQLFEYYANNLPYVEFEQFVSLSFTLLGDDINSANSSRGKPFLMAVRDGLFYVTICYQIYLAIGQTGIKYNRFMQVRERDEGTYKPSYLVVTLDGNGTLELATAYAEGDPTQIARINRDGGMAHIDQISRCFSECGSEGIVLRYPEGADPKDMRQLRNRLGIYCGCPVHNSIPDPQMESAEVTYD